MFPFSCGSTLFVEKILTHMWQVVNGLDNANLFGEGFFVCDFVSTCLNMFVKVSVEN